MHRRPDEDSFSQWGSCKSSSWWPQSSTPTSYLQPTLRTDSGSPYCQPHLNSPQYSRSSSFGLHQLGHNSLHYSPGQPGISLPVNASMEPASRSPNGPDVSGYGLSSQPQRPHSNVEHTGPYQNQTARPYRNLDSCMTSVGDTGAESHMLFQHPRFPQAVVHPSTEAAVHAGEHPDDDPSFGPPQVKDEFEFQHHRVGQTGSVSVSDGLATSTRPFSSLISSAPMARNVSESSWTPFHTEPVVKEYRQMELVRICSSSALSMMLPPPDTFPSDSYRFESLSPSDQPLPRNAMEFHSESTGSQGLQTRLALRLHTPHPSIVGAPSSNNTAPAVPDVVPQYETLRDQGHQRRDVRVGRLARSSASTSASRARNREHCDRCGKDFASLSSHHRTCGVTKTFFCQICKDSGTENPLFFADKTNLNRHLKIHSRTSEEKKRFRCDLCPGPVPKIIGRRDNMMRHLRIHHANASVSERKKALDSYLFRPPSTCKKTGLSA
ncbi:hypothetical protein EJ06DRAFT_180108 [Trichodelitschia bisporula]|uniref:C2H2-type domain-containing protein n=1 Tax=Trichodelitschia bisporula TaxID=703511 RepID=A0A6G1HM21_9PEZI|nr:hypothetical protein EJ06DRAFT_180108 [Trichodelitschia bisporula]